MHAPPRRVQNDHETEPATHGFTEPLPSGYLFGAGTNASLPRPSDHDQKLRETGGTSISGTRRSQHTDRPAHITANRRVATLHRRLQPAHAPPPKANAVNVYATRWPAGPLWSQVAHAVRDWRGIWTSSGVSDTVIFLKP